MRELWPGPERTLGADPAARPLSARSVPGDRGRRGGQLHRDAEPAAGPGCEREGSVVRLR